MVTKLLDNSVTHHKGIIRVPTTYKITCVEQVTPNTIRVNCDIQILKMF